MKKPLIWLLALSAGLLVSPVYAQYIQNRWHTEAFRNFPNSERDSVGIAVRQGSHIEWQRSATGDDHGNWYFSWSSTPNGIRGLYACKINSNGDTVWIKTVNDGPGRQEDPVVIADSTGLVIAWVDYREGNYRGGSYTNDTNFVGDGAGSVMAQKLDPNGNRLWNITGATDSVNAVPVCMTSGYQNDLRLVPDGAGGAYVMWEDTRNNRGADIYGNRIDANGSRHTGWSPNGNAICAAAGNQPVGGEYTVDVDGRTGAWVAWVDNRRNHPDIYYQHVYGNGTMRWSNEGQPFIADTCELGKVKICPDGSGGAFLAWRNVNGTTIDIWMQRIDSSGAKMWSPDSGVVLESIPYEQTSPRIVYAGAGSAIVSWEDFRNDPSGTQNEDIYAQKVSGSTTLTRAWPTGGVAVCTETHHQRESRLASDGSGGCVLVWEDERTTANPEHDIYAQRVQSNGTVAWSTNGLVISAADGGQIAPVCRESGGRLLLVWSDSRLGSRPIYHTVWNLSGQPVGTMPATGALTIPDITGNVTRNSIVGMGTSRLINYWVDARRSQYGNRIYYSIHNSGSDSQNGSKIASIAANGNPITLDSTNRLTQDGTAIYSAPLTIGTPDSGSIIVYFNTAANGSSSEQTLRAQKISYSGARSWTNFGREICSAVTGPEFLTGKPDGSGGAYLAFTIAGDAPYYYNEVHFQHVNSAGQIQLASTGAAINPGLEQQWASLVVSGSNIYVGYIEVTDAMNNIFSVRVCKLNPDGSVVWNHILASGDSTGHNNNSNGNRSQLRLVAGDSGSVVAYWMEFRFDIAGGSGAQIMAQRVDANGNLLWGEGVRLGASEQAQSDAIAMSAGSTYWLGWKDTRIGGFSSIYLQHLSATGGFLLDSVGQRMAVANNAQTDLDFANDAGTGVYMFFSQFYDEANPFPPPATINDAEIEGLHLNANGAINRPELWTPAASHYQVAFLEKMPAAQKSPKSISRPHGAAVNWVDLRATGKEELINLYMQRVRDDDSVGVREIATAMPKQFTLLQNYPNPFNSTTVIRFTLPRTERVKVAIYDIMGREVINLLNDVKTTGTYEVRWNGKNTSGMKVSSGMYFYRMETSQGVIAKKMTLLN